MMHPCNRCRGPLIPKGVRYCEPCQARADAHERQRQREVDARRPAETRGVYSSPRWLKARARFLAKNKHCRECGGEARYVDHVKPWRSFPPAQQEAAFWDERGWAPMCGPCHSRKTAARDGGFGNARRA